MRAIDSIFNLIKSFFNKFRKPCMVSGTVIFAVVFLVFNVYASMLSTVALEQEVRCGIEEHIHADECYRNDLLICEVEEHVHDENCYLILLDENDINGLLTEIDNNEEHSLEGVITDTVSTAMDSMSQGEDEEPEETEEPIFEETEESPIADCENEDGDQADALLPEEELTQGVDAYPEDEASEETGAILPEEASDEEEEESEAVTATEGEEPADEESTAADEDFNLDKETIAEINKAIAEDDSIPNLTLNENINSPESSTSLTDDYTADFLMNEGVSLLSVGDDPSSSNYNANFYIYLDDSWQCIGTLNFSVARSGNSYAATVPTEDVLELINTSLGTSLTRSEISLYYATSATSSNYTAATVSSSTVTLGTSTRQNNLRSARYVRIVAPGQNGSSTAFRFYTVRLIYSDGTVSTQYVQSGTEIVLPEGFTWVDASGTSYTGGDIVTITAATDFNAVVDDGTIILRYDVNFPTVSGVTVEAEATVDGESTATETVEEGNSAVIKRVSEENVIGDTNSGHSGITRVIHFKGWLIDGTDIMLLPNTVLNWESLEGYASGGRINLIAQWDYSYDTTCTFYVKYDSMATTTGQASTEYTPCIFTSYVAGVDPELGYDRLTELYGVNIDAVTDEEIYEVDQLVRAKYGSRVDEPYLTSFPDDAYIFEALKQYASDLTVDGIEVSVDELNENGYAIRWYVFKCQSDSWHIDGKLVRKHGHMDVTKTFAGNKNAVELAKEGFYIEAAGSEKGTEYLTMDNYIDYNSDTNTYTWEIEDVAYGEEWVLTEKDYTVDSHDVYSEYIITDASGEQSRTGVGDSVTVYGMTYAADLGVTEVLQVDFVNVYRALDSLVIKKEDSETGRALSGAKFKLYQNDELLNFTYDDSTDTFYYDPSGDISELSCENSGFLEISVKDISYEEGEITVSESVVPSGYAGSGNVLLGYMDDGSVGILNDSDATFSQNVLIIPNTSNTITVTVEKSWLCPEYEYEDVEVQLFANGRAVNALFPTVSNVAYLTEENGYTYTWSNLAAYANGEEISWSVRETKIGDESCRNDYSFVNWLVYYQNTQYSYDDEGNIESVLIPVTNDIRRVVLRVTKTNMDKSQTLSGAKFTLTRVNEDLEADENTAEITLTTKDDGQIIFEDLTHGTYALTEIIAPDGYELIGEPVYITINGDSTITVSDNFYVEVDSTSSMSVIVKNSEPIPFPETGGDGIHGILIISLLLMASAIYIYKLKAYNNSKNKI